MQVHFRRHALRGLAALGLAAPALAADPPPPGQRPPPPKAEPLAAPGLLRGTVAPTDVTLGALGPAGDTRARAARENNARLLQAAIDEAADQRRFFELPPGRYEIDRPGGILVQRDSLRWIGARNSTIVQFASDTPILHVGRPLAERRGSVSSIVIDGARLEYASDQGDRPESNALQLNRIWMSRFENLELGDPNAGGGLRTPRSRVALRLRDSGPGAFVFSCSFRDIRARCFAEAGLLWDSPGTGNLFQNCYFSNNTGGRPRGKVVSAGAQDVVTGGMRFERALEYPGRALLRVVSGPGAGQIREVAERSGERLRLASPWAERPGAGAELQLHAVLRASDAGIAIARGEGGNQFDGVLDQCNVEWLSAPTAVRLQAVRGITFSGLHVEAVIQTGRGLFTALEGSAAELRGGAFYDNVVAATGDPDALQDAALFAVGPGASLGASGLWIEARDDNRSSLPYAVLGSASGRRLSRPASVRLDIGLERGSLAFSALDTTEAESAGQRVRGASLERFAGVWPQPERTQVFGDEDATLHWGRTPRIAVFRGLSAPRAVLLAPGMAPERRFAALEPPGGASFRIVNESAHALRVASPAGAVAEVPPGRFLDVAQAPGPASQSGAAQPGATRARAAAAPEPASGQASRQGSAPSPGAAWSVTATGALR